MKSKWLKRDKNPLHINTRTKIKIKKTSQAPEEITLTKPMNMRGQPTDHSTKKLRDTMTAIETKKISPMMNSNNNSSKKTNNAM